MSYTPSDEQPGGFGAAISRDPSRMFDSRGGASDLPSLPTFDLPLKSPLLQPTEDEAVTDQPYVEFDFNPSHHNDSTDIGFTQRFVSSNANESVPINPIKEEVAPKADVGQKIIQEDDFFQHETADWQSMKKVTQNNFYDEMGNLEYTKDEVFNLFNANGGRGYTKIDTEEQLNKYSELDKKTDFLFEVQHSSKADLLDTLGEEDDEIIQGEESIESDEALAGTKGMLTESQIFAYIGIVKLIMNDMATELAKLNQRNTTKMAKKLSLSQKNFANWTLYIMSKIVDHFELAKEEKEMIDNLGAHGVEVNDLTGSLLESRIKKTRLEKITKNFDLRWVLICDLLLLLISDGYYDSRSRTLLFQFAKYLDVNELEVRQFERRLVESLELDTSNKTIENKDEMMKDDLFIKRHIQKNKRKRLTYIGLATLGGSLAIGLSAGLLAPVIGAGLAAGLTTVGISGTGGFLAGIGGSVAITTSGVAIGAKVGNKAGARRVGDVHTFELKPLHNNKRANLILTVSGWMNGEMDDVRLPFSTVDPVMGDIFSLLWEPEMLRSMGQTIGILASEALSTSIQQILGATILAALMSAIQLPMALSKLSYLLDNPWNVSLDRAWKAGKILADTLISGNLGVRPVTLVGFSLGSRVIYSCLIELASRGGYGLIEDVILLGNPVSVKYEQITLANSVVSGRFINGYSKNDWILGYLFRATGGGLLAVAGISPIENIPGVENFDCTELVEGHMSYRQAIPKILKAMNWEVLSEEFAEIEEPEAEQKERHRKLISEFDEARAKMEKESLESNKAKGWKKWFKPKQKNWWDIYDEASKEDTQGSSGGMDARENADSTAAETDDEKSTQQQAGLTDAIFDLNALAQEVNDIANNSRVSSEGQGVKKEEQ